MDIQTQDGILLRGIPEGTPDDAIKARIAKIRAQAAIPDNLTAEKLNPTNGMSGVEKFRAGVGSGLNDIWQGISFAPKSEVDATKATNAALMDTGAGFAGNVAGNIAGAAPAMFVPGANTMLGASAIGAGVGALTTGGDVRERATGAGLGAAGGAIGQAIPKVFGAIKAAAEPLTESGQKSIIGRVMNRAAGDNAPDVAMRLRGARELVPGSAPTAAEVGESGGIAALQRAMSAADPEAYAHRGMQQANARVGVLREIAGDEGQREMFAAARATTAKDLYDQAYKAGVDLRRDAATGQFLNKSEQAGRKGEIRKLMSAPAMEDAAARARTMMKNELGKVDRPEGSVQGIDYMRRGLADAIGEAKPGSNEKRILVGLKDRLDTTLDAISPKYGEARRQFAAMSEPINRMDIGKVLVEKLQPALSDHGALAKETAARFASALRNEGETVAREATGMRRGMAEVLHPYQMDQVNAVAADLARKANAQDLGRGVGSNTFQNFAMDNLAQQGGMPSAVRSLMGHIPGISPTMTLVQKGASAVGGLAYKRSDEAMRQSMAKALLNPQESAALMDAARKPNGLARLLSSLPPAQAKRLLPVLQALPGAAGAGVALQARE